MTIEATAEALAPEQETVPVPEVQEPSADDQMAAIWDKQNTSEAEPETPSEPVEEAPAEEQPVEESKAEAPPVPSDIPRQLKQHWNDLPEDARTSIEDFARETNRKLSDQGRMVQGIAPIRDALTEAVKDFPQMADMKPADIAKEVFDLAKVSASFQDKPVETMMGLIDKHGLREQMQAVLAGQPVRDEVTPLKQELASLKRVLQKYDNPDYIRAQVTAVKTEQDTLSEVQQFAASADHWGDVEDKLPPYVEFMRAEMGQDASAKDVLEAAYDLAVSRIVPQQEKAPEPATDQVADIVDPEKAQAALKAKSVNVRSKPSTPRALSEDEVLAQAWDKSQKR